MSTLYLDRKGLAVRAEKGALILAEAGQRVRTVPFVLLDRVVVQSETSITSTALSHLAEAGVGVLVLSRKGLDRSATLLGRPHSDVRIRMAQYRLATDAEMRYAWAARLLRAKLEAQANALRGVEVRGERACAVERAQEGIERILAGWEDRDGDFHELLGREGAAAAAWFQAYAALLPPSLNFTGRNRRPPRDPVNACLSLGYTLLHFDAIQACQIAGLDPLLGILHQPAWGRESLAADMIEPLRPLLDLWVRRLFLQQKLRKESFVTEQGSCHLQKSARRTFYEAWEVVAPGWRRRLQRYCGLLARSLRTVETGLSGPAMEWEDLRGLPGAEGGTA